MIFKELTITRNLPLYQQIARILRQEIIHGEYPVTQPFPDELLLASRFHVSKDVIRVSLRLLAKEGLLCRIRSKGTFVTEAAARANVLPLIHVTLYQGTMESLRFLSALEPVARRRELTVAVTPLSCDDVADERAALERLTAKHPAALFLSPAVDAEDRDNAAIYRALAARGIPLTILDRYVADTGADLAYFDYESAMYEAVVNLWQSGCRSFAFCMGGLNYRVGRMRWQGALRACREVGISVKDDDLVEIPLGTGRAPVDIGREIAARLQAQGRQPDAVVASAEWIAWGAFQALREEGRHVALRGLTAIADAPAGDEAFNRLFAGRYRLFDELGKTAGAMLEARRNGDAPVGAPLVRPVPCPALDGTEAARRFWRDR